MRTDGPIGGATPDRGPVGSGPAGGGPAGGGWVGGPGREELVAAGRRRRLLRLAGPDGVVAGLAIDHRDSLRVVLDRQGLGGRSLADLRALKRAVVRAIAPDATALLLDAEMGATALADGSVPAGIGLIMPLEAQGYEEQGDRRLTTLLDDFSPLDAVRHGADACKLLLPYRADDRPTADRQDALAAEAIAACHAAGLPIILEPVVHRLSTEAADDHAAAYRSLVVAAVDRLRPLGADLLKLPYPVPDPTTTAAGEARAACAELAAACGTTPWVLLGGGGGTDADGLVDQIRIAGEAGASGFLAGRAIWGPVIRADPEETGRLAAADARAAFARCRSAAAETARPLPGAAG